MDCIEAIKSRRSVRSYTGEPVFKGDIKEILDAGRWAPSGLNNQPWKFMVVEDAGTKQKLSECTKYSNAYLGADKMIAVFLDEDASYDRTKDVQAVGACIQNMLLAAHSLGLGAVWQGEILNQKKKAENVLEPGAGLELMAVILVGQKDNAKLQSSRKPLDDLMISDKYQ